MSETTMMEDWLRKQLANGPVGSRQLREAADRAGLNSLMLDRAARSVGAKTLEEALHLPGSSAVPAAGLKWTVEDVVAAERRERERCFAIVTSDAANGRSSMVAHFISRGTPAAEAVALLSSLPTDAVARANAQNSDNH